MSETVEEARERYEGTAQIRREKWHMTTEGMQYVVRTLEGSTVASIFGTDRVARANAIARLPALLEAVERAEELARVFEEDDRDEQDCRICGATGHDHCIVPDFLAALSSSTGKEKADARA